MVVAAARNSRNAEACGSGIAPGTAVRGGAQHTVAMAARPAATEM